MAEQWTLRFSRRANEDKYKIPRGEAALFADAVSVLRQGPAQPEHELVKNVPHTYSYIRNGYLIAYEVLEIEQTIRVVYFDIMN